MKRLFGRCGHAPGALTPEDQVAVDALHFMILINDLSIDGCRYPPPFSASA